METWRTKFCSVVSEFEGTLLNNKNTFSYFMLLAFDASGLFRFAFLLFLWPVIALIDVFGYENASLRLMTFVAFVGLRENNIKHMAKIILPKFYMDDLTVATWTVFGSCTKKVVVTRMPRVMVEWFAKEHLGADEVIGPELDVNRFGFLTSFLRETDIDQCNLNRVASFFVDHKPYLGLGRPVSTSSTTFMSLCEEQILDPINPNRFNQQLEIQLPKPVIFHAARFVNLPTPATSLLILLWIPFGILLAATRIIIGSILPMWVIPYIIGLSGVRVIVKGEPPIEKSDDNLLFVCNHRTMIDPVLISYVLGRRVPAVTSNVSRFYDILTPVPIVRFTKNRDIDAVKMKQELSKGDLVLCPEGTFCFQPFVFRFSAMFAEVTDKIVPVAIDCKVGLFQNPIRTWDGLDMIILFMNPIIVYQVTFLNQLPTEETCLSGKSSYEVANHVQRILADTLGFECTNLGRKHESMFVLEGYKKSH